MTTIETRLSRLQVVYRRSPGCDRCSRWGGAISIVNGEASRPECCPDCSRRVAVTLVREYRLRQSPHEPLPPGEDPADPSFGWPTTETN